VIPRGDTAAAAVPVAAPAGMADTRIADLAALLRAALTPLLHTLAGTPPRPVRLTQQLGLDKSLASRLVQAAKAASDAEFLHVLPSPTGLRMLLDRSHALIDAALQQRARVATDCFEALLDTMPGGRQALDAHIGETAAPVRERREQMARQASFKAVSFLFGHYCDTLVTSLFILPSATAGLVDLVEIHRRIGLRRVSPSASVPLLSVWLLPDTSGAADRVSEAAAVASLDGRAGHNDPHGYLVAEASSQPLPAIDVVTEGPLVTFLLKPAPQTDAALRLTTAYRVMRADRIAQSAAYNTVRNYMLHTPCGSLVRDVFLANGLWPDAMPHVGFYLPSPSGTPGFSADPAVPHFRRLNLTTRIEQLPAGAQALELSGVADQRTAVEAVLARAGLNIGAFRGWRCRMSYPVPLVEMRLTFCFTGLTSSITSG
jgi:hypothetical protein